MTFIDLLDIGLAFAAPMVGLRLLAWLVVGCLRLFGRARWGPRTVRLDADELSYRGGKLKLSALASVRIITTAQGPFVPDVFWILETDGARLVIPQEAPGFDRVLDRLQTLPRFDNDAVIRAMTCTDAGEFLCWQTGPVS